MWSENLLNLVTDCDEDLDCDDEEIDGEEESTETGSGSDCGECCAGKKDS